MNGKRVAQVLHAWADQLNELADKLDATKGRTPEAEGLPPGASKTNIELQPCYRGNDWCPRGCCSHLFRR